MDLSVRLAIILGLVLLPLPRKPVLSEVIIDRPVMLAFGDWSRHSTSLWLKPAFCLFEDWLGEAVDKTLANRETAFIQVEVRRDDDNSTYKMPTRFSIPNCDPLISEPQNVEVFAYQLGPDITCINDSCVVQVLPDSKYWVRYALYSEGQELVAATNWSEPLLTKGEPGDHHSLNKPFGRSGGMVVITVILSVAMCLLLVAMTVALVMARK
ncbi:hypothetical protein AOXY_G31660 [Acipenser oxyrinchus oxyrinchus]|uniref:Uncharacterized protein n=1 Tax=Acipenser oxyrinchus oxyrinchus TaxID=40147 RepID=A0AAD8CJZ4_ACIOX|nr:hypothetical protein AOXY_G31660 [Acipenser oxyrinchus oxyrinchus]